VKPFDRVARARRLVAVFVVLLLANAAALMWLDLPWIALVVSLMITVILYDARRSVPELEGDRIVLRSTSRFRHVIEYGVIALGGGFGFAADVAVRRFGVEPPWRFGWGSVFFIAVPAVMLSFHFLVPRLCAFAGIGTGRGYRSDEKDGAQSSSSS
jgi:hypothetical protein